MTEKATPVDVKNNEGSQYADPAEIFKRTKTRYRDVDVPTFGLMMIRSLSEQEKADFEAWVQGKRAGSKTNRMKLSRAKLITLCVVDPRTKDPAYREAQIKDLMPVDGLLTGRLFDEILEHIGYTEGDLEELLGN